MKLSERFINAIDEDSIISGKNAHAIEDAVNFIRKYEDAEEQGRLVILPCKIGDTVYFLQRCLDSYMFVNYGDVIAFHVYRSYITVEVNDHDAFNPFVTLDVSAFGKTVFLTREEAEAALKGGHDDV